MAIIDYTDLAQCINYNIKPVAFQNSSNITKLAEEATEDNRFSSLRKQPLSNYHTQRHLKNTWAINCQRIRHHI